MSARPFPDHMYRVPDPGDTRIPELEAKVRELEAALLETNDAGARLVECAELLEDVVMKGAREVYQGARRFDIGTVSPAWLDRARAAVARLTP